MVNLIKIYTDGACTVQHEKHPGGWGAYLIFGEQTKEIYGGELFTTNNRMELLSVIKGLQQVHKKSFNVIIYTDSAYVHNAFKLDWIGAWKSNGWKNSKKKAVENKDLWLILLDEISKFISVKFEKVEGHGDCQGNIIADKLAVKGKEEILTKSKNRIITPKTRQLIDDLNNTPVEDLMLAIELMDEHDRQRCMNVLRKVCGV